MLTTIGSLLILGAGAIFYNMNTDTTKANEEVKDINATYDYWKTLTYEEQKEYFENNEYLKIYTNDFYANDRELTAKHVQHIANNLNREFTNKYDRY